MEIFKKPYEISLWEDRLVFIDGNLNEYEFSVPNEISIATSYYKERRICIIGSHTLNSPIRAINPQLKRNINGSNTLTFSIYAKYYDEEREELLDNPYVQYLVNERKVKLKYIEKGEAKWLDFIIKNISENSETYLYSYTAEDLFVNELSKTGYNLMFDSKLNNNYGSIQQLGEKVIAGTDWQIKEKEPIQQFQKEALYKIENFTGTALSIDTNEIQNFSNATIYTFYSCVANQKTDFFQFIYREDSNYELDEDQTIINATEYYIIDAPQSLINAAVYASNYRGKRRVRQQKQIFDNILQKNVQIYIDNQGKEIYQFLEKKYINSQTIKSYISNSSGFSSTSSWDQKKRLPIKTRLFPSYEKNPDYRIQRLSTLEYIQDEDNFLFNSGITDDFSNIDDFVLGDSYIFRIDCRQIVNRVGEIIDYPNCNFNIKIASYYFNTEGEITFDDEEGIILNGKTTERDSQGYFWGEVKCQKSVSKSYLKDKKIGIFITADKNGEYYIIDSQLFKKVTDENKNVFLPFGLIRNDDDKNIAEQLEPIIKTNYYFYYPGYKNLEEIEYVYIGPSIDANGKFSPSYSPNYEKIRSISASGTNRFNLLQTLSEIFECWCQFEVKHKETGEIMLEKDWLKEVAIDGGDANNEINSIIKAGSSVEVIDSEIIDSNQNIKNLYRPLKFISFQENVGQINNVDFIYGINLKSINRTLESNELTTKLIVKTNSNQFAQQGGCDISRAKENPTRGNVLYNFNQYITQGILNGENFYNDLYSLNTSQGWLGFYVNLKNLNTRLQQLNNDKNTILSNKANTASQFTYYSSNYEKEAIELNNAEEDFYSQTNYHFDDLPANSSYLKINKIIALAENIFRLRISIKENEKAYQLAKKELEEIEKKVEKIDSEISLLTLQKEGLISKFENKYSRFIQEGPWNSEDYVDDTLYYLDAESTLYHSAQPKINYTINIVEISSLEGYGNFAYGLGDITHIQDTDYFGWILKDGIKTPYREKVVVTETIINFDSPEKDTIKVQNHRTQFEDLFQRMAAVTQKVEFYSGGYERAASIIKPDGSIASEVLADAFSKNEHIIQNSNNQTVKWDEKGISTTNAKNPSEIVRIVSGGVFISNDGGATWSTGITGNGINAKIITAGQLNTGLITIYNGNQPAFRWDDKGISAYRQDWQGNYDIGTYVRYDQFGLYGIKNSSNAPASIEEIWQNASFSLTWRGFKLKTEDAGGSVSIDTENDFIVTNNKGERVIQIGRIEKQLGQNVYGIVIMDKNNQVGFKAISKQLTIGGWEITAKSFESPDINLDGQPEFAIYSTPISKILTFNDTPVNWRILSRKDNEDNFGLSEDGVIFSKGINVQGNGVSFKSNRELVDGKWQQIELTTRGINLNVYNNENDATLNSQYSKTLQWKDIIDKIEI